jgi:hypothetical protein
LKISAAFGTTKWCFCRQCAWIAANLLHIPPFKITVVSEIKTYGVWKMSDFCNQFISGLLHLKLTFFICEANFNLLRYVNSQNNRCWSSENAYALSQLPPYDKEVGMVCD